VTVVLWILQLVLAFVFLAAGLTKLSQPRDKLEAAMAWVRDFTSPVVKAIGLLEVLAAFALIIPWLFDLAPVFTPLAALGLVALMVGATLTHLRRKEIPYAAGTSVLLVLSAIVAVGRF
jgi:uncharacterized membrane protein YphA (DoxX/SURF4 family)